MTVPAVPEHVDLAVVGAGTAGAATAGYAAARGLRVVCLERRALDAAGARWVNGVTRAGLAEAGIAVPPGAGFGPPTPFHLIAPQHRVSVPRHDVIDLDMRALVAQLQARAQAAGAILVGGVTVRGRDGATLATDAGPVRARWIVDASGLAGAGLLDEPAVAPEHLCAAAQGVFEVRDRAGAAAYFGGYRVAPDEICAHVGRAGGFSILNVRLHAGGDTLGVLTGSIPALGFPSGKAILDEFVRGQPWLGPKVFGGAAAIPLRRPRERLTDGTVALVGDAGCQVFPAHGSGINAGILAGKLLVDTVAAGGSLADYEVAWHRRWGGLFAAYDAVRRWNQRLTADDLDDVIARGLFDAELARAGLDQELPRLRALDLVAKVRGVIATPGQAPELGGLVARTLAVQALAAAFPRHRRARRAWSAIMQRVLPV